MNVSSPNSVLAPQNEDSPPLAPSFPLSTMQEALWVYDQINPGSTAYNLPEAWQFEGNLDYGALTRALVCLLHRHETLRTIFFVESGQPKQKILPPSIFEPALRELPVHDISPAELPERLMAEAREPFSLGTGPLFRAALCRLHPGVHVLLLNVHHIVADAWSQAVLMRELAEAYNAFAAGRAPEFPELSIQYADFACWQRDLVRDPNPSASPATCESPPLPLPCDFARSANGAPPAGTEFLQFPPELSRQVREFARGRGMTPFVVLLAGFQALLNRLTDQDDITVGSPFSGREPIETEGLIGFFVSTVPLRVDASGDPAFSEFLGRVRESVLGAWNRAGVGNPTSPTTPGTAHRRSGVSAPFQVVFGLQTVPPATWTMAGLQVRRIEVGSAAAKFDWTVLVTERPEGLSLRSEYDASKFLPETPRAFVAAYRSLLEAALRAPESPLSALPLVTPSEQRRLLEAFQAPCQPYESEGSVPAVFQAQARAHPEAIALDAGDRTMTYGELDRRTDVLAARLLQAGVAPGSHVGICLERSADLVVAILATLKAGAAYVPLEPSLPDARLAFVLRDAQVRFVFARSDFDPRRCGGWPVCVIGPEADGNPGAIQLPGPIRSAGEPAYVMYTSGSTGQPKGVVVPHRAIVRLVRNTHYARFDPGEVFLLLAPASFDASTFEIWGALLNGARLAIAPPGPLSLEELGRVLRDRAVTTLWLTAGLFHQMIDYRLEDLRGLRQLLAGGDVLSISHVRRARRELPECRIVNGYGPTENTTFTCCYTVPLEWPGDCPVPIGVPVGHTRAYVLDAHFRPVPVGIPGELFAAGDGLALGYLDRPELTAERFIVRDLGVGPERLYRTGDRARWRHDGLLEFLGRFDNQVKIRGFRVEPAEIEAVLAGHPAVREAAVVVRPDPRGEPRLVAYAACRETEEASEAVLAEYLAARLPDYMLPSAIVRLPELPLTPNGKVDRQRLPAPPAQPAPQTAVLPQTELEKRLLAIWAEVLGRSDFGVRHNFFELGGHSLLATQVLSRISGSLQREVPLRVLFEAPTIETLATAMEQERHNGGRRLAVPEPLGRHRINELLARLDELSETELDELLKRTDAGGSVLPM